MVGGETPEEPVAASRGPPPLEDVELLPGDAVLLPDVLLGVERRPGSWGEAES